ncbi:hypothetical protein [uncultured Sphingomonas sp.]|uniref:hypothetical protein n=1 Tax=uncultured Sphingomonas sp. TaxID=158754 RepID=UPI0025FFB30E|nr:hypothetical protein [uncultured Sphingomonas sp.]
MAASLFAVTAPQPSLALAGTGTFDHRGVVHTLWAGVAANRELTTLRGNVERARAGTGRHSTRSALSSHTSPLLASTAGRARRRCRWITSPG